MVSFVLPQAHRIPLQDDNCKIGIKIAVGVWMRQPQQPNPQNARETSANPQNARETSPICCPAAWQPAEGGLVHPHPVACPGCHLGPCLNLRRKTRLLPSTMRDSEGSSVLPLLVRVFGRRTSFHQFFFLISFAVNLPVHEACAG